MNGGKWIAVSWLTLLLLVVTFGVWSVSNMGDCPTGMTCSRAVWLDPLIAVFGIAIWALGVGLIARKRA